jgi:hypothetical protein
MNLKGLKQELERLNIPPSEYSLIGGLPNESYCIDVNDGVWEVYYSERGNKTGLKIFEDENSACEYFLDTIL